MYKLFCGNSFDIIKEIEDQAIDLVITDPPYFLDGMGSGWNKENLEKKSSKAGVVGALPVGMKFDPKQGKDLQKFMEDISIDIYRVLKPGGFYICFSQARLYHRVGIAIENCGFEIRDMIGWKYSGQAKAFSMDHFVNKMKIEKEEKEEIIKKLDGRKTPQLKPQIEPMVLAQKPKEGTFINNWLKYETGLIDVKHSLDGTFPGNIIEVNKPNKIEKGVYNDHLTVKPIALIEHLIRIFSKENQTILDPFNGSGTTGIACLKTKRNYIGIDIEKKYIELTIRRIKEIEAKI